MNTQKKLRCWCITCTRSHSKNNFEVVDIPKRNKRSGEAQIKDGPVTKTYLETKEEALKGSKSSKCSPDPRKAMGLLVAATALNAPPPLA